MSNDIANKDQAAPQAVNDQYTTGYADGYAKCAMNRAASDDVDRNLRAMLATSPPSSLNTDLNTAKDLTRSFPAAVLPQGVEAKPVEAKHIGWDYLDDRRLVATYAVPVPEGTQTAPKLYAAPVGTADVMQFAADTLAAAFKAGQATAPTGLGEAKAVAWPKLTLEMMAAFKQAYQSGSIWTDRITYAVEEMLRAAPAAQALPV